MSENQVSKEPKSQESGHQKNGRQENGRQENGHQGICEEEVEAFGAKCAKCMDPCVKIALITFPIFLIASILIGILGLSSQGSKSNNSTDPSSSILKDPSSSILKDPSSSILKDPSSSILKDPSSSVLTDPSSSVPVRNVTRFKAPTSTSTMIFRSDIIHTSGIGSNGDEDTHFYSILFLILALTSLIVIFCGKYWTIGLYNPPTETVDFSTNPETNPSIAQPASGNRVLLEEQITTV